MGFNLVYLKPSPHTAGFQRMGKDCPESSSCPAESYLGAWGRGGAGGAARLQISRGQPHVHGTILAVD